MMTAAGFTIIFVIHWMTNSLSEPLSINCWLHMWISQLIVNRTLNEHANHNRALSTSYWYILQETTPALIAFVHQIIRNPAYRLMFSMKCLHCRETLHPLSKERVFDLTVLFNTDAVCTPLRYSCRQIPVTQPHKHTFLICIICT